MNFEWVQVLPAKKPIPIAQKLPMLQPITRIKNKVCNISFQLLYPLQFELFLYLVEMQTF